MRIDAGILVVMGCLLAGAGANRHGFAIPQQRMHPSLNREATLGLHHFDEEGSPARERSEAEVARRWQEKIAEFDGYIVVTAEYNRGPPGVLKNALDYAYNEWNNKPIAFVGYGSVGGARAIEHLRLSAIELQMAPIRTAVPVADLSGGDERRQISRKLRFPPAECERDDRSAVVVDVRTDAGAAEKRLND